MYICKKLYVGLPAQLLRLIVSAEENVVVVESPS